MTWTVQPNAPTGTRLAHGFVDRYDDATGQCVGGYGTWEENTYTEEDHSRGRAVRSTRVRCDVSLRTAAQRLGLRASELSDVEAGRSRLLHDGVEVTPEELERFYRVE